MRIPQEAFHSLRGAFDVKAILNDALSVLAISAFTLILLYDAIPFWGSEAVYMGDDLYTHASFAQYVLDHWPDLTWFHVWYGGIPLFEAYHPVSSHIWALLSSMFNADSLDIIRGITVVNFVLVGVLLYAVIYVASKNRILAFFVPLLLLISPGYIELISLGGAYSRLQAYVFLVIVILCLIIYAHKRTTFSLIITALFLGLTVSADVPTGQQATLFTILFFAFLTRDSLRKRLNHLVQLGFTAIGISAFFVVPFIGYAVPRLIDFSVEGGNAESTIPIKDIASNVFAPLIALCAGYIVSLVFKAELSPAQRALRNAALAMSLFMIVYAGMVFPLHWFATYDTLQYLPLHLCLAAAMVWAAVFSAWPSQQYRVRPRTIRFATPLILLGLSITLVISPFTSFTTYRWVDVGATNLWNPSYIADNLVDLDNEESKKYRMATDWIHVERWYNYAYPTSPQTGGVYPAAAVESFWQEQFTQEVFRTSQNMPVTEFFVDWYGVKWLLLNKVVDPIGGASRLEEPIEKFLSDSDFSIRNEIELPTGSYWADFGEASSYLVDYEFARPIVTTNNEGSILFMGSDDAYRLFFASLSYLGNDGASMIPVHFKQKLNSLDLAHLGSYDIVVIDNESYEGGSDLGSLNTYVENGGGLFIIGSEKVEDNYLQLSPIRMAHAIYVNSWRVSPEGSELVPTEYLPLQSDHSVLGASYIDLSSDAIPIIEDGVKSIVAMRPVGKGRVVWSGLDYPINTNDKPITESKLLHALLRTTAGSPLITNKYDSLPEYTSFLDKTAWQSFGPGKVDLENRKDFISGGSQDTLRLKYDLADEGTWFEQRLVFLMEYDWREKTGLSCWVLGDGSNNKLKFTVLMPNWDQFAETYIPIDFLGWKRISLPFASMVTNTDLDLIDCGGISLTLIRATNDTNSTGEIALTSPVLFTEQSPQNSHDSSSLNVPFEQVRPGKYSIQIVNPTRGVLVREAYDGHWKAELAYGNNQYKSMEILSAGPGFMYIPFESGDVGSLTLSHHASITEALGRGLSLLTMILIVGYCVYTRFVRQKRSSRMVYAPQDDISQTIPDP